MNAVQESYEALPYPHCVHPLSHPARLAAVGKVLGYPAADAARARVLDIGCGSASSLLAMAARMPDCQFTGIDFSGPDIASAQETAREAGLTNVEFQQADLMDWNPRDAKFDFIIAYGFFSWVPDEVKDRLLQLIAECLAPQGIACVSYMTYPGCKQPEALRDLLKLHTGSLQDPMEKVVAAHRTLDFLDRAWQGLPKFAHSSYLREEAKRIRQKEPHFLLFDDLGVERDPCYLLQFTNWAAEHGLYYLGESEFHTMLLENLPLESGKELAAMALGRLETEQLIDYITNRAFRCSLLVGAEAGLPALLDAQALRGLSIRSSLKPVSKTKPGATEGRFLTAQGSKFTLRSVPLVAFIRELALQPEACLPFQEVLSEAQTTVGQVFDEAAQAQLAEDLLTLYAKRHIEISALAFIPPTILPEYPCLTRLNLAMCRHRGIVVDAHHRTIQPSPAQIDFCLQLDGSRSLSEIGQKHRSHQPLLASLNRLGCLMPPLQNA